MTYGTSQTTNGRGWRGAGEPYGLGMEGIGWSSLRTLNESSGLNTRHLLKGYQKMWIHPSTLTTDPPYTGRRPKRNENRRKKAQENSVSPTSQRPQQKSNVAQRDVMSFSHFAHKQTKVLTSHEPNDHAFTNLSRTALRAWLRPLLHTV